MVIGCLSEKFLENFGRLRNRKVLFAPSESEIILSRKSRNWAPLDLNLFNWFENEEKKEKMCVEMAEMAN